jgi:phenylalanyl-tRNA synthetase beta chain
MKVSISWIKQYLNFELPKTDDLVEKIGAQLGAVEEVIDIGKHYQGIIIAKVVVCQKLENSDHLNVCKIDDGGKAENVGRDENGYVQVVCGAPNVRQGITVAWLPPGTTVPSSFNDELFVLEVRELRGVISNGMLASAKELAIGDNHEGLLILDDSAQPGADFAATYHLNDQIIDIENKMFTHRPDCFGELGVAREVAGILGQRFTSPDWYLSDGSIHGGSSEAIKGYGVTVEIPELCPRYMLIGIDNIKIGPSPAWLQATLAKVGLRPINNIVDVTNYIMIMTGQPLHAFDFDKIAKDGTAQIIVRHPHNDEEMTLLDGKTLKPRKEAILITANEKPIALGGVKGGGNSEIDDNTTRILLECANFDMYNIRKTSMEHGIFTDAVSRFNKGQSAAQCAPILTEAVRLIQQVSPGAQPVGQVVDVHETLPQNPSVKVTADYINARLGLKLADDEITTLLTNVEFQVAATNANLHITAPFWRTDIQTPEDIIEEVGRLYGFDHLPLQLPQRSVKPAAKNQMLELRSKVRASLAKAGANETLNYSFVPGSLLEKVGQNKDLAFQVSNALSPDLQYYRMDMLPSLLDKVHPNIKAGYDEFAIFEMGKSHILLHKDDGQEGLPLEIEMLSLVYAANDKLQKPGAAFYEARHFLEQLAVDLGMQLVFSEAKDVPDVAVAKPYQLSRAAYVSVANSDVFLGMVGEFNAATRKQLKLPEHTAGFEIGLEGLLKMQNSLPTYKPLSRFPKVEQDICLRLSAGITYGEVLRLVAETVEAYKPPQSQYTLAPVDIYQRPDDQEHKQITLRLTIASQLKTLTDVEVSALLDHVTSAAQQKFDAQRL